MKSWVHLTLLLIFGLSFISNVYASEPLKITQSSSMKDITFDGKWTHEKEWKQSSYEYITTHGQLHLRFAHFEEFLYVMIDAEDQLSLNFEKDFSIICFDGKNEKSSIYDPNDFCFKLQLGNNSGETFQGDSTTNSLLKIDNHDDLILISSVSGEHNRYSAKPHPVYEFRIPIELIDRSNNYGFFMMNYDSQKNNVYSWPLHATNSSNIPSPNFWGDLISPDNTLPEFHWISLVFIITTIMIIFVSKSGVLPSSQFIK